MGENVIHGTATVTGTASEILGPALNGGRKVIYFYNASAAAQVITIQFGTAQVVTAGQGIVLVAGQSYIESRDAAFIPWQDRISAIASAAGGSLVYVIREVS